MKILYIYVCRFFDDDNENYLLSSYKIYYYFIKKKKTFMFLLHIHMNMMSFYIYYKKIFTLNYIFTHKLIFFSSHVIYLLMS